MARLDDQQWFERVSRRQPGVAAGVRAPGAAAPDPGTDDLDQAVQRARKLAALRIEENSIGQMEHLAEADRTKAQVEQTRAQLELQRLLDDVKARNGSGPDQTTAIMGQMFQAMMEQNSALLQASTNQYRTDLKELVQEIKESTAEGRPAPPGLADQMAQIDQILELARRLSPPAPEITGPLAQDAAAARQLMQDKMDYDLKREELNQSSLRWQKEMELQMEKLRHDMQRDWATVNADVNARQSFARTFEQIAPGLADGLRNQFLGGPAEAAAGAAGEGAEPVFQQVQCPACGRPFQHQLGPSMWHCPHCKSVGPVVEQQAPGAGAGSPNGQPPGRTAGRTPSTGPEEVAEEPPMSELDGGEEPPPRQPGQPYRDRPGLMG